MSNINKKERNHTCPLCGRDYKSHKIGSFITKGAREICEADQQVEALNVIIPVRRSIDKPENYARLIYNPWN